MTNDQLGFGIWCFVGHWGLVISSPLLISLIPLTLRRHRLGVALAILRQRLSDVIAFVELPLVVAADVTFVPAGVDQFAFACHQGLRCFWALLSCNFDA